MSSFVHTLVPTLWLCWLAYWIVAARGVKDTARHESAGSRLSHHAPLIAGAALLCFPNILGARLEGNFVPHTPTWLWIGSALVVLGLGFAVAARVWLGGNWSSTVTLKRGHELIRSGPYALARHPIYTGLLLAVTGTTITIGNWRALIGLALMIAAIVRKLTVEERFMADQFGEDYARYRSNVAALIPFIL
jgi:protein-S-isoprenylcysteine O-methyltransferase Ste14